MASIGESSIFFTFADMHEDLKLTRCRSETNFGDFESIWNGIQQETNATRDMLAEEEAYKHFGD